MYVEMLWIFFWHSFFVSNMLKEIQTENEKNSKVRQLFHSARGKVSFLSYILHLHLCWDSLIKYSYLHFSYLIPVPIFFFKLQSTNFLVLFLCYKNYSSLESSLPLRLKLIILRKDDLKIFPSFCTVTSKVNFYDDTIEAEFHPFGLSFSLYLIFIVKGKSLVLKKTWNKN